MVVYAPKQTSVMGQPTLDAAINILNSGGDTSYFNAATWEALKRVEAQNNAAAQAPTLQPPTTYQPTNTNNTNNTTDPYKAMYDEQQRQARESASAWLTNTLSSFGLSGMGGSIDELIKAWGTNYDVIGLKLKETSQYKTRFKGLLDLQARGITDIQNEGQYIQLETQYRQVFREAGLGDFLGAAGSSDEQSKIADIVSKYSLSVNEVRDRVGDAQRIAASTSQEVKDMFKQYYGADSTQLVAYSLDPTRMADVINRQANAAIAGGLAAERGLNIGVGVGEQIANLAGNQDINQGQVADQMVTSQAVRDATARLADIEHSTLSDSEVVQSTLNLDADAVKRVKTLQSRERARFGGSSATTTGTLSRNSGS